jgi:hypothetical protein
VGSISRLLLVVVLAVTSHTVAAQITTPVPASEDRTFQGTLLGVDSDSKTLTAKGADNKEIMFHYTANTEIIGSENGASGLAGKSGSDVSVTYNVDRGVNNATRIEFAPHY